MTIVNLPENRKKLLAQKIRALVEPYGAATQKIISEVEIRRLILEEENITIDGMAEIIEILNANYTSEKTIERIVSKIKQSVVWDTSICNLPTETLNELFYKSDKSNIITSLTFDELLNLTSKTELEAGARNITNSQFICLSVLEDTKSEYCISVNIPKTGYVDTQLIEFCAKHNYSLYTFDMFMGLRAKSNHIDVKIFNDIVTEYIYTPSNNSEGKDIILDIDVLENSNVEDIVSIAENIKGKKFVLTNQFVEEIEKQKDNDRIRKFALFFLYDAKNDYSIYLNPSESSGTITELSKKYDAIIFTSDIQKCFSFKTQYHNNFKLVTPIEARQFMENIAKTLESTNSASDTTTTNTNLNTIYSIPHYANQTNSISTKNLPVNEKIWVLDNANNEIIISKKKTFSLSAGYTVIHGINSLKGNYEIKAYKVIPGDNFCGTGKLIFETQYEKNSVNTVEQKYRHFAKVLTVLT